MVSLGVRVSGRSGERSAGRTRRSRERWGATAGVSAIARSWLIRRPGIGRGGRSRSKLRLNAPLRALVCEKLGLKWAPEQIAGWLRRTYPDDLGMQVSQDTICLSVRAVSRRAAPRVCAHLRRGQRVRRPPQQRAKHKGQGHIPGRVMISERPAEAQDRAIVTKHHPAPRENLQSSEVVH